jgi:universal stress protein F
MTAVAPTVRSVLAALDESERAPLVFATAVMMARQHDAQVFLVHVVTAPPDIPPAGHTQANGVSSALESEARAKLQALMDGEPAGQLGPPIVVEGNPWRRILDVARDLDVDLIVVGSHRYHGLDRVLGTVAAKVVNHADRNVLVVHDRSLSG